MVQLSVLVNDEAVPGLQYPCVISEVSALVRVESQRGEGGSGTISVQSSLHFHA